MKALIQLLAASKAGKELVFCPPGDSFQNDFIAVIEFLKKEQIPPGRIYKALVKYWPGTGALFQWIEEELGTRNNNLVCKSDVKFQETSCRDEKLPQVPH